MNVVMWFVVLRPTTPIRKERSTKLAVYQNCPAEVNKIGWLYITKRFMELQTLNIGPLIAFMRETTESADLNHNHYVTLYC